MNNIITLTNGKRVANFSSPHPFTFEDGSVLPAVDSETAVELAVEFIEINKGDGDIELYFDLPYRIWAQMRYWNDRYNDKHVDIVFCPLPMITALKEEKFNLKKSPFRAIRIEDRIKKLVSINKQCI